MISKGSVEKSRSFINNAPLKIENIKKKFSSFFSVL